MIWPVAIVTGHRPQHLDADSIPWIHGELGRIAAKLREAHGTTLLISGMALGADMLWASTAYRLGIDLRAHIPFPQQPDVWTNPDLKQQWQQLVDYAQGTGGVRVYGDLAGLSMADRKGAVNALLHQRNDGMIAETVAADGVCVAVLRSSKLSGGTRSAYTKAVRDKVPIIRMDPDRRTTTLASAGNHL